MSPAVLRIAAAALLIAGLQTPGAAEPGPPVNTPHDPDGAVTAPSTAVQPAALPTGDASSSTTTPWLDLGNSPIAASLEVTPPRDHKLAAALTLGGMYAAFTTWTYFAWYRKHKPLAEFEVGGDGWFGSRTYAGGADKLGHAWATMSLARAGTELLHQWGGYSKLTSTIVATALSELLFLGVEVKDGFYYELSISDAVGDTVGAALAAAFSLSPRLDEMFDFRVQYWPSREYRRQLDGGNVNIAEDYTGETYVLAYHLGSIHALRDTRWGVWSRFVDVAIGYGTRGYKPDPPGDEPDYPRRQELSVGVSLNLQGLSDWLFERRSRPAYKIGHGLFEVFNGGYLPAMKWERRPNGAVMMGGA